MTPPGRWRMKAPIILHGTAGRGAIDFAGIVWQIGLSMDERYPGIARACFHLNWVFLVFWALYLLGPDATGWLGTERSGPAYGIFSAGLFLIHFVLISTGIIALFVVIIEVHAGRPVRGFMSVIAALALPMVSFLYFAARYLSAVRRFLEQ